MCTQDKIIVTLQDLRRLLPLLEASSDSTLLDRELYRATLVDQHLVPPDVVTMNTEVVYEDRAAGGRRRVRLVYPQDAEPSRGRISILSPLGSALLGLRTGQLFDAELPSGKMSILVVEVRYQPEASGDLEL
ncbi:MAG TPA: nucleoside diphosphate kinase regulator [Kofleriaceae bacterium]|jgi:regulator of nucleoside diphosphate kinase|nr:nucleoside diphosphate kinase regulator [Kofleriaceae bacterium]